MTPYKGDSKFVIFRSLPALLDALEIAQREYENAKNEGERATQQESDAVAKRKLLKRDLINELIASGKPKTAAEKEYVDEERWKSNEEFVLQMQEKKRAADVDESLARQQVLTLRAAIIPVTVMRLIEVMPQSAQPKLTLDSVQQYGHAAIDNADGDPAHSADPSVAHNA